MTADINCSLFVPLGTPLHERRERVPAAGCEIVSANVLSADSDRGAYLGTITLASGGNERTVEWYATVGAQWHIGFDVAAAHPYIRNGRADAAARLYIARTLHEYETRNTCTN